MNEKYSLARLAASLIAVGDEGRLPPKIWNYSCAVFDNFSRVSQWRPF